MKCPKCRTEMVKKEDGEHKYIFVCPKCGTKIGGKE